MEATAGYGPLNNQTLDSAKAMMVQLTPGSSTKIESVEFVDVTSQYSYQTNKKYWVIIYNNQSSLKELIRYQACATAVELKIVNTNQEPMELIITHWSEKNINEFEQCNLTREQN